MKLFSGEGGKISPFAPKIKLTNEYIQKYTACVYVDVHTYMYWYYAIICYTSVCVVLVVAEDQLSLHPVPVERQP